MMFFSSCRFHQCVVIYDETLFWDTNLKFGILSMCVHVSNVHAYVCGNLILYLDFHVQLPHTMLQSQR